MSFDPAKSRRSKLLGDLARQHGVSLRTIQRDLKASGGCVFPTIEGAKPWVAAGISRATWFRRRRKRQASAE